jgi:hypothetical protein
MKYSVIDLYRIEGKLRREAGGEARRKERIEGIDTGVKDRGIERM